MECFVSGNKVPSSVLIPIRRLRNPRSHFSSSYKEALPDYFWVAFFCAQIHSTVFSQPTFDSPTIKDITAGT